MSAKKLFFIAGEPSGDFQGALLIRALKQLDPGLECRGLGGALMAEEGMTLLHDLTKEAVLGLGDVLKKYFLFRRIFERALKEVRTFRPDAVILIDYPGFNLRFARRLAGTFPVIYYISPQIWAWGGWRIHAIRKTISRVIVFFEFEADLYQKARVPVTWIGHPLRDLIPPPLSLTELRALRSELLPGRSLDTKVVALLPGSRATEVKRILPAMLRAAAIIRTRIPGAEFLLAESPALDPDLYQAVITETNPPFFVRRFRSESRNLVAASDFALVSSGTATLETALSLTPFVILYKTAWSTFFLGRMLIRIPYIGLVNVVAGRKIIPEFVQHEIVPEKVAEEAVHILEDEGLKNRMVANLKEVQSKLGPPGAVGRAAEAVLGMLYSDTQPVKNKNKTE